MPAGGGLLTRLLQPLFRVIARPWHMVPLGFLFGLGFDTATEIGLLGMAAAEAARGVSPWQTMVFPALFTAGMVLVDSADSVLMVGAYGWALHQPRRKLWYDLAITGLSVAVALLVGGLEVGGLLAARFVRWKARLDPDDAGSMARNSVWASSPPSCCCGAAPRHGALTRATCPGTARSGRAATCR